MRKLVFSFLVVFSSIVFGQSGFNPPKSTINEPLKVENIGLDTVYFANDSIRVFSTIDGLFIDILNRFSFVESGVAERISVLPGGNVGINTTTQTSTFQVNGSQAGSVTNITATTTLNETHNKILVSNGATNITITLPNALTCLGREYVFSRAAGSTGSITIIGGAGNQMQALNGAVGATTSISLHGATGQGLNVRFTAVNIAGVGYWVRL